MQEAVSDRFEKFNLLCFCKSLHSQSILRLLVDFLNLLVPVRLDLTEVVKFGILVSLLFFLLVLFLLFFLFLLVLFFLSLLLFLFSQIGPILQRVFLIQERKGFSVLQVALD